MRVLSSYLLAIGLGLFIFQPLAQAAQTYRLSVKAIPSNAKITIWNIKTPFKQNMRLAPGRYDLQVHKAGYKAYRGWVTIKNKSRHIKIKLLPKGKQIQQKNNAANTYPLHVNVTPADAKVQVMNIMPKFRQGMDLKPGSYDLKISHPKYKTLYKTVRVKSSTKIGLTLESIDASATENSIEKLKFALFISALPPGTEIIIWNIKQPFYQGMPLESGRYDIQITSPGYKMRRRWIEILDHDLYLGINLEPIAKREAEALVLAQRKKQAEPATNTAKQALKANAEAPISHIATPALASHYRLTIQTQPQDAHIALLNHEEKFDQGMLLEPGAYHLSVSQKGYPTRLQWVEIKDKPIDLNITLSQKQQCFYSKTAAGSAENRTQMTRLLHLQFYGNIVEALYSTRMLPDGNATRFRLFGKQQADAIHLIGTIYYGKEPAELHSRIHLEHDRAIMAFDGQQYILKTMKCPNSNS